MTATRRQLVCLTPVRNEAWILDRFLRAASTWADAIIVLDHVSDDGSADIARAFPKVHLIEYAQPSYDDPIRRGILVNAARELVRGPSILIALDADEVIAADAWEQQEMRAFLIAAPGTVGRMRWINVLPSEPRAWIPPDWTDFLYVDDGAAFSGTAMHGPRVPPPSSGHAADLYGPKVLHLQYLDWERMRSKQRWYQAQERIEYPRKRPIQVYRQYHHMDAIAPDQRHTLRPEWLARKDGANDEDILAVEAQDAYATDGRVLDLLAKYGVDRFRRTDLWDGNWERRVRALQRDPPVSLITDPHTRRERLVFAWLARTQHRARSPWVRWIQRALRLVGW